MREKIFLIVWTFLAGGRISGCAAAPLLPVVDILPVVGVSYQGYTIWKGRESMRYYSTDVDTTFQAVKRSIEQLKLETETQIPASEKEHSLQVTGIHPMQINVLPVEQNLTKIVITIPLFGDKQYVEFFYKTIDSNISKKTD